MLFGGLFGELISPMHGLDRGLFRMAGGRGSVASL